MSDAVSFEFSFADGTRIDLEELGRRTSKINNNGRHQWTISVMYNVADPDQAMDTMELGGDNFIGLTPIHCMICLTEYEAHLRYKQCPLVVR